MRDFSIFKGRTFRCVDDLQVVVDLMKEQGYMALLEPEVKKHYHKWKKHC